VGFEFRNNQNYFLMRQWLLPTAFMRDFQPIISPKRAVGCPIQGGTYFYKKSKEDDTENDYDWSQILHQKAFIPAVMVSTVDQVCPRNFIQDYGIRRNMHWSEVR